jgi:hypothetical protein
VSPQPAKLLSGKWVVIGTNPDGSAFVVKCQSEAEAVKVAREIKGKVKKQKKGR